ncbi:MAG: cupin, partial [Alphaproteobacteria bacterium]
MPKTAPKPPALDPVAAPARRGTLYPEPYKARVAGREKRALGTALGLQNFGVNLVKLEPGAHSALRHW